MGCCVLSAYFSSLTPRHLYFLRLHTRNLSPEPPWRARRAIYHGQPTIGPFCVHRADADNKLLPTGRLLGMDMRCGPLPATTPHHRLPCLPSQTGHWDTARMHLDWCHTPRLPPVPVMGPAPHCTPYLSLPHILLGRFPTHRHSSRRTPPPDGCPPPHLRPHYSPPPRLGMVCTRRFALLHCVLLVVLRRRTLPDGTTPPPPWVHLQTPWASGAHTHHTHLGDTWDCMCLPAHRDLPLATFPGSKAPSAFPQDRQDLRFLCMVCTLLVHATLVHSGCELWCGTAVLFMAGFLCLLLVLRSFRTRCLAPRLRQHCANAFKH